MSIYLINKSPLVREFMSKNTSVLFKKSLIAAAVLSLSACSSTPRIGDYDLGSVGAGIAKAGRTTADVSGRVWNKTTYLLGFSDDDGEAVSDEGLLMDAEDVALLDGEATSPRDTVVRPIVIRSAIPTGQQETPTEAAQLDPIQTPTDSMQADQAQAPVATLQGNPDQTPTNSGQTAPTGLTTAQTEQTPTNTGLQNAGNGETVLKEDLIHEVAPTETLWDIAKKTTGDANNWHILADTNNLGPGASVFPGQELVIPADMVKQDYGVSADVADTQQAAADLYVDTQNLTGNSPVADVPTDSAELTANQQITGKPFKVNPGETLWDFAKRITGDATNWQAIAGENNFSDEQASYVRTGQTIYVPEDLVKPELDAAQSVEETKPDYAQLTAPLQKPALPTTELAEQPIPDETADELAITVITSASAAARKTNDALTSGSSLDMLDESANILDETKPIKIVEATFKSSKSPVSTAPATVSEAAETMVAPDKNGSSVAQIMVSGTYYPKAVYNEADFSSSLLMRVSPGTTLQVSKAMGSWYQVKTDKGLGYVHQRDIK